MPEPRLLTRRPPMPAPPGQTLANPSPGPVGRARASLRALEALDRITSQDGEPSAADLEALRGWAGWGPMAPAFSPGRKGAWREIGERLEGLLPPGHLPVAEPAPPHAVYTPPPAAACRWQVLR